MRAPAGSLLSQTHEQVVQRQIEYGEERGVPWGISESAYNARDMISHTNIPALVFPNSGSSGGLAKIWLSHHMPLR